MLVHTSLKSSVQREKRLFPSSGLKNPKQHTYRLGWGDEAAWGQEEKS